MVTNPFQRIVLGLSKLESSAPIAVFRIVFGTMMLLSILRFWLKGWISELYIEPLIYFPFVSWAQPLEGIGMYMLFGLCALCAMGIALGFLYRISAIGFFLSFTYIELLDKTNYLNHYYFVSLMALILILIPAHRRFSLDIRLGLAKEIRSFPTLFRRLIMLQLGIVYFYAGIAKLNSDWLFEAQPMSIWLKSFGHWPVIGWAFDSTWLPYFFSWSGAIFDISIPFLLYANRTRPYAYAAVLFFHIATAIMFPIGMFPFIMMVSTLIFFPPKFHENILHLLGEQRISIKCPSINLSKIAVPLTTIFLLFQMVFPFRYLAYPGELFWHEQGYRFSWRVMLMEKTGTAFFYVQGDDMPRPMEVQNRNYLSPNQEKMMSTQADMILQYADFLEKEYAQQGISNPQITAKIYVTLNGRPSRLFVDPNVNLAAQTDSWKHKSWILPLNEKIYGL